MLKLFTYFIIPVFTIYLAIQGDLFGTNLSGICSRDSLQHLFILWAITVAGFSYYVLTCIVKKYHLRFQRPLYVIITTSSILLLLSSLLPYLPRLHPLLSQLHMLFAFSSTMLLLLLLFIISWQLCRRNSDKYRRFFLLCIGIDLISFSILLGVGIISGFLEIFITISCTCLSTKLLLYE